MSETATLRDMLTALATQWRADAKGEPHFHARRGILACEQDLLKLAAILASPLPFSSRDEGFIEGYSQGGTDLARGVKELQTVTRVDSSSFANSPLGNDRRDGLP